MAQETVATDPLVRRRGLTRAQYDALVETGALDGEPVELLEGVLVEVVPQGDARARAVMALTYHLLPRLAAPWQLRTQLPLAATEGSEPEPDLAVVQLPPLGHPRTAALVVELAQRSQRTDLVHKPAVCAAAGVEQYWVVDLPAREVVVHTRPGRLRRRPAAAVDGRRCRSSACPSTSPPCSAERTAGRLSRRQRRRRGRRPPRAGGAGRRARRPGRPRPGPSSG